MKAPKLLYRATGFLDAKTIQILLQSFGIQSQIIQESAGVTYGLTLGKLGSANIYVDLPDVEEANKILSMMENGELELPDSLTIDETVANQIADNEIEEN